MRSQGRGTIRQAGRAGLLLLGLWAASGCGHDDPPATASDVSVAEVPTGAPARGVAARGRSIYRTGQGLSGRPISARYGEPAVTVAAPLLVCANCHGEDGTGRPEGGIEPSDITWESLTRPYAVTTSEGRRRVPYSEETLRRAITLGFDSGGAALAPAMPRYQLSREDLDDLVAYLKTLGSDRDPGITPEALSIGVVLAPASRATSLGEPVRQVLAAFVDRINEQGGIYGRRIELRLAEAAEQPEDRARALVAFVDAEPVLALLCPFAAGTEGALEELAARRRIPVVGPLSPTPRADNAAGRYVFYLDAGIEGEARALIRFVGESHRPATPPAALIHPGPPRLRTVIEAVRDQARREGWPGWREMPLAPEGAKLDGLAARLRDQGITVILALCPDDEAGRLVQSAAAIGWAPELLIPGSLAGRSLFEAHSGFGGRIVLALPTLPADQTSEAVEEYRDLSRRRPLSAEHRVAHWSALAAGRLLVEGLRRAGRNLNRERLVAELEGLRDYRTGFAPPLTYGPTRRVGAWGAHLVELDPPTGRIRPPDRWIELPAHD